MPDRIIGNEAVWPQSKPRLYLARSVDHFLDASIAALLPNPDVLLNLSALILLSLQLLLLLRFLHFGALFHLLLNLGILLLLVLFKLLLSLLFLLPEALDQVCGGLRRLGSCTDGSFRRVLIEPRLLYSSAIRVVFPFLLPQGLLLQDGLGFLRFLLDTQEQRFIGHLGWLGNSGGFGRSSHWLRILGIRLRATALLV